ncbi:MAG: glycosyltransferase, partial [Candidatus Ratteibacteria bacterium]
MDFKKELLILIPAYNEARFIAEVIKESAPYAAEVAVVDDGSIDGTGDVAE